MITNNRHMNVCRIGSIPDNLHLNIPSSCPMANNPNLVISLMCVMTRSHELNISWVRNSQQQTEYFLCVQNFKQRRHFRFEAHKKDLKISRVQKFTTEQIHTTCLTALKYNLRVPSVFKTSKYKTQILPTLKISQHGPEYFLYASNN